jgi:hypothetical protein
VKTVVKIAIPLVLLAAIAAVLTAGAAGGGQRNAGLTVQGGATTMVEGGTGGPDFVPVLTKLAFHWDGNKGRLECLALAPSDPAGDPGSGDFDTNAMYVTGPVTSARIGGSVAVLRGTSTVTGLGAGKNEPFRLVTHAGGPGTKLVLRVSGLVFREIVLEGDISF